MMLLREAAGADTAVPERAVPPAAPSVGPPAGPPAGPSSPRPTCFVAATPAGPVLLEVDARARHAADAAITLDRCDVLLCALQRWSGIDLDWRWIDPPSWRLSTGSHAAPAFRIDDTTSGRLELPWALLRGLAAPPASLAACLEWPLVRSVLAVARLHLDADELALLEPGGAVVLPQSLRAPWRGRLRAADEPAQARAGVPVDLSSPDTPRLVAEAPPPDVPDDDADVRIPCEVRLDAIAALPGDRLGGWCDGAVLDGVGAVAGLWQCAGVHGPARPLAVGRLVPWGDGWALAVELLDDNESTLLPVAG